MDKISEEFTSLIKLQIKEVLPRIEDPVLHKATADLIDAGVGELEDLAYVQHEYLSHTLKPIE